MSTWLAEDPELLRAALDIIETWEGDACPDTISVRSPLTDGSDSVPDEHDCAVDLDSLLGETTEEHKSPEANTSLWVTMRIPPRDAKPVIAKEKAPVVTRELKPSTIASTRHRRREEIIFLRDKVKEMEATLAALRKVKTEGKEPSLEDEDGRDKALAVLWHGIATRQQRLRQKSELEQAKLRKLLETQMKVAQGLMKLMQKARRMEEEEGFPQMKRMKLLQGPTVKINEADQLTRIHASYERIEDVFSFSKFHDGCLKFVDIEVMDELEEEVVIEYREAWTVPFDVDRVMDALWEYTLKKNKEKWAKPDFDGSATVNEAGTELVSRFTASSTICGFTGISVGQSVVKRFIGTDDKAPAIITSMRAEPHPTNPGDIEGFVMLDDAWMRVIPIDHSAHEVNGNHVTNVQCMQRFIMQFDKQAERTRQVAGTVTEMILDKIKDDIELKHDMVETLLVQSRSL